MVIIIVKALLMLISILIVMFVFMCFTRKGIKNCIRFGINHEDEKTWEELNKE